jgi:hypothetical protein
MALGAVASIVAFAVVERLARRFLPLAALLRLSLVFPDCAPSRFSVAMRATSVKKLQRWAEEAHGDDEIPALAEKVVTLASALNAHDRRTRGHSERSRAMADLIAEELQLSPAEANEVRWGAFLHDIGKLLVPAEILNKPGAPTPREWVILQGHPAEGARLVEPLRPFLGSGVDAVGAHHEHFDGSGYPHRLVGEEISLVARIVAVADSFEVMTAVRSYKRPMTAQAARAELVRQSGTQFDPRIVRAFLNVPLGRLHWALGLVAWVTEIPFLTVIPRAAAQVSAVTGGGTVLSTSALSSIATVSLGAMAVAGPSIAHAAMSGTPATTISVQAASGHLAPSMSPSAGAGGASGDQAQPSTVTPAADTPSASEVTNSPDGATPAADNSDASASSSSGSTSSTASSGQLVAVATPASTTSNTGGNGTASSNGITAVASSNAGGNGNGNSGSSNAGGNGNSGSSNAGGNGGASDDGITAVASPSDGSSSSGSGSNAGGKGKGKGKKNASPTTTTTTTTP